MRVESGIDLGQETTKGLKTKVDKLAKSTNKLAKAGNFIMFLYRAQRDTIMLRDDLARGVSREVFSPNRHTGNSYRWTDPETLEEHDVVDVPLDGYTCAMKGRELDRATIITAVAKHHLQRLDVLPQPVRS